MFRKEIVKLNNEILINKLSNKIPSYLSKKNLIVYEEEIFIDNLSIPVVRKRLINEIIKNHMIYKFGDINQLYYSYDIIEKNSKSITIKLFCINSYRIEEFKNRFNYNGNINIFLIQLCYGYFFSKYYNKNNFILIYHSNGLTYLLGLTNKILNFNQIIHHNGNELETILKGIDVIVNDNDSLMNNIDINIFNFPFENIISGIEQSYEITNWGEIGEDFVIKRYIG